jgi:hypothetical protein
LASSDKEKADLFAEHLQELFTSHKSNQVQEVDSFLNEPIQRPPRPKLFNLKVIQQAIITLKPKESSGQDNITAVLLQQLPRKGQIKLLCIFNAMLRLGYWPRPIKTAQIIMILKPGENPTDVTSYRPIKLLPTIAKVLEKTDTQQNKSRVKSTKLDTRPPVCFPAGPLKHSTNASHCKYHS